MDKIFGIIVSGRLVETNFVQVGEAQFLFTVPDADDINHVVVFLTGTTPFPEGTAGAVYFSWPDPISPPNWQFLGQISNSKPSAIFKISSLKRNHEFENSNLGIFGIGKVSHVAQIGISIEPSNLIEQKVALQATDKVNTLLDFGQKLLVNFLNFVSSYTLTQSQMTPNPTENYVPLSAVQNWYATFERRIQQNPNFWKN